MLGFDFTTVKLLLTFGLCRLSAVYRIMPSAFVPHVPVKGPALEPLVAQPILIRWNNRADVQDQYFGCLRDMKLTAGVKLTLWIGRAPAGSEQRLLINLHLTLNTRPTLNKTEKDIFLIIPAEHLRLDFGPVEYGDLPEPTQSQLKGVSLEELRNGLTRVHFSLGTDAYAIMPKLRRPLEKPLTGVPGKVISSMRSLSETKQFDVYFLRGDVDDQFHEIQSMLDQGDAETPDLDLTATFRGGSGGGKNLWQSYPYEESGNLGWNPLVDDTPPPYETVVREDINAGHLAKLHESRSPGCANPLSQASSASLFWRVKSMTPERRKSMRFRDTEPQIPPTAILAQKRKAAEALCDNEGASSKRDASQSLSNEKPQHDLEKPPYEGSTEADASDVLSAGFSQAEDAHWSDAGTQDSPAGITTPATHPPDSSPPPPPDRVAAPFRAAVRDCLRARVSNGALPSTPSSSPVDLAPLHVPHLFLELKEWLAAASQLDPLAHETDRLRLLALGAAARRGDARVFAVHMRACQRRLLRDAWRLMPPAEDVLLHECFEVLDWLNRSICRNAGTVMMRMLVGLRTPAQGVGMATTSEGEGGREREEAEGRWREGLALVRAAAFWAFG